MTDTADMTNKPDSPTRPDRPDKNPLLNWTEFPDYGRVEPRHVEPAVDAVLARADGELSALEAAKATRWDDLMAPLERLGDRVEHVWGVAGHLNAVRNSVPLREAYQRAQPSVVQFLHRLGQSRGLFDGYLGLQTSKDYAGYDGARRRVLDSSVRDARLAGVELDGPARERFLAIGKELADLGTRFQNNVLDATKAFSLTLKDPDEIAGLPATARQLAAEAARAAGNEGATTDAGPWVITLDAPSFTPFMQHARRRDLREMLYRAHVTRASTGQLDNLPIILRSLVLAREKANMLGYDTHAEMSLTRRMAPDVAAVEKLLGQLRNAARPAAQRDLQDLQDLARQAGAAEADSLQNWDVAFWAERLREKKFRLTDEQLRPYFPLPGVLDGLFGLAERLFDIRVTAADAQAPVWHKDVRFFRVANAAGQNIASFYLDPYSRPAEKRGGAWMDSLYGRSAACAAPGRPVRLPVAYMCCNQTPPSSDTPSLMSFDEMRTLFHEFGHALQHMLTIVDCGLAAGINNIEWDAVELASQFMENWCYDRPTLRGLARHWQTGEPLPDEMIDSLIAARSFREGSATLRQVTFSMIDLELYHRWDPSGQESPLDVQRRIADATLVMPPLPEDRFLCSFSHIFAGGYSAGYYSYKWAAVLSADAFGAFEEAGLGDEQAVRKLGRRFRDTVLALGGSRHPMEVFKDFRGREPQPDALLRHSGLV